MKKNIKMIVLVLIGIIIGAVVSGIGVYATLTYSAGDISYTKSGTSAQISVSSALNELYQNKKETTDETKSISANGTVTLDKYYKNLNVNVPIPSGYSQVSGTKSITTKANNIDVSNFEYVDTTGMYTAAEYAAKTGESNYWNKGSFTISNKGTFTVNLGFQPKTIYFFGNEVDGTKSVIYYDGQNFIEYFGDVRENYNLNSFFTVTSTGFKNGGDLWTDYKGDTWYYLASYN